MVTQTQILLTELAARERLLRDQRTSTEQAETLLQVVDALQATETMENGFDSALEICRKALKGDVAVLLQRSSEVLETLHASDPAFGLPTWPLAGQEMLRPLCITSISHTRLSDSLPDVVRGYHSLLSTPLPCVDGPQMVLVLLSHGKARFTRPHQVLIDRIGGVIALTGPPHVVGRQKCLSIGNEPDGVLQGAQRQRLGDEAPGAGIQRLLDHKAAGDTRKKDHCALVLLGQAAQPLETLHSRNIVVQ